MPGIFNLIVGGSQAITQLVSRATLFASAMRSSEHAAFALHTKPVLLPSTISA
jgi:hypothetical protein